MTGKKTATQHKARLADKAPVVELVPKAATKALESDSDCGATAYFGGIHIACEREPLHDGLHAYGNHEWRRRSGDPR